MLAVVWQQSESKENEARWFCPSVDRQVAISRLSAAVSSMMATFQPTDTRGIACWVSSGSTIPSTQQQGAGDTTEALDLDLP